MLNSNDNDRILNFFNWETEFDASLVIDGCIYPNNYTVKLSFLPRVTEVKLQNNSFDRIKYLFNVLCNNAVITSPDDQFQSVWFKMPVNKILLPGNPYDQLFARCLYKKMVSISGEYLHIGQLTLDSRLGDNVQYTIDSEIYDDGILEKATWIDDICKDPWWNRNDTATFDQKLDGKTFWQGTHSWRDLGYGSDAPKKPFNPTIINGGKD